MMMTKVDSALSKNKQKLLITQLVYKPNKYDSEKHWRQSKEKV